MSFNELRELALQLPDSQRAEIALLLLDSLEADHHMVSDSEVERRAMELRSGSVDGNAPTDPLDLTKS